MYNLKVESCELPVAICDFKEINSRVANSFKRVKSNFTSCKFILPVGNKIMSCKLSFARCELLFKSYNFKEIIFRVASCVLWTENWKFHFKTFTSWKIKTITFTSC